MKRKVKEIKEMNSILIITIAVGVGVVVVMPTLMTIVNVVIIVVVMLFNAYFSSKLNNFSYKLFSSTNNSRDAINTPSSSKHLHSKHQLNFFHNSS